MTQYNTFNLKLSNSQLNKLKSGIKNGTKITLNLSSNVIGDPKVFANNSSANIKLSKNQLSKMVQGHF